MLQRLERSTTGEGKKTTTPLEGAPFYRHPEVRAISAFSALWRASKDERPQTLGPSPFEGRLRRPPQGDGVAFAPILPSVPASSRAMLARCMIQSRAVSSMKSAASAGLTNSQSDSGVSALATNAASDE